MPFHTSWDLRALPEMPTIGQVVRTVQWATRQRDKLNRLNRRVTVLLPTRLGGMQGLIRWMLDAFGPSCDKYVGDDEEAALRFERGLESDDVLSSFLDE